MNGFLVINKAAGMTSYDVIRHVKRLGLNLKLGHTGTLDPNVTGVLPLVVGKATKAIPFLSEEQKSYRCTLLLGQATDTEDVWGTVLETHPVPPISEEALKKVLAARLGPYQQVPPMYSAVKKHGKKLYELARAGETIDREPRLMTLYDLTLLDYTPPYVTFDVVCSRGTYVRTLCVDLAKDLGTLGTMSALIRLASGPFSLNEAVALEEINSAQALEKHLLPITWLFKDYPRVSVNTSYAKHCLSGVKVDLRRFLSKDARVTSPYQVWSEGVFLGMATMTKDGLKLTTQFASLSDLKEPNGV